VNWLPGNRDMDRQGLMRHARSPFDILRLGVLGASLAAASPAAAFSGVDLLGDVCLAGFPRFDNAAERIASFHAHAISYDGRQFEQVDADKRSTWTVNDGSDARVDRFLVNIAWGTLHSLPAASCYVADKRGFTLAEVQDKFAIKEFRVRPERPLYTTVADAIVEGAGGRRLWLTLTLAPGQVDPGPASVIGGVTLMSSEYLNAVMEKAQ
jgi:hypothetical protein